MQDTVTTDVQNCYTPYGPWWEVPRWGPYSPAVPVVPPQIAYIYSTGTPDPRVEMLTQEVAALRCEIAELRAEQQRQRRRSRRYGRQRWTRQH